MTQKTLSWSDSDGKSFRDEIDDLIKSGFIIVTVIPTNYYHRNNSVFITDAIIVIAS